VLVGHRIAQRDDRRWVHLSCVPIVAALHHRREES
jgi:hypothetical protein